MNKVLFPKTISFKAFSYYLENLIYHILVDVIYYIILHYITVQYITVSII